MTIIESIRTFFTSCPALAGQPLHTDQLPDAAPALAVETYVPDDADGPDDVILRYVDGGCLRQYRFRLALRLPYGEAHREQNAALCQDVADWVDAQLSQGNVPELPGNRVALTIATLSEGYRIEQATEAAARYVIPGRLIYLQGGTAS